MLCYIMLCYVLFYYIILYYIIFHIISYCMLLYFIFHLLYYIKVYYSGLYYILLYYMVVYCIIVYYSGFYYSILMPKTMMHSPKHFLGDAIFQDNSYPFGNSNRPTVKHVQHQDKQANRNRITTDTLPELPIFHLGSPTQKRPHHVANPYWKHWDSHHLTILEVQVDHYNMFKLQNI